MWEHVRHETYKGHDIRSSPREVKNGWKIRLDITFPMVNGDTIHEYLCEELLSTLEDAHNAGFKYGRQFVDERKQSSPLASQP